MINKKYINNLNFDALLEVWASLFITVNKRLPEPSIKFRNKLQLLKEINKLNKKLQ